MFIHIYKKQSDFIPEKWISNEYHQYEELTVLCHSVINVGVNVVFTVWIFLYNKERKCKIVSEKVSK